jgi:hypothetical protein
VAITQAVVSMTYQVVLSTHTISEIVQITGSILGSRQFLGFWVRMDDFIFNFLEMGSGILEFLCHSALNDRIIILEPHRIENRISQVIAKVLFGRLGSYPLEVFLLERLCILTTVQNKLKTVFSDR